MNFKPSDKVVCIRDDIDPLSKHFWELVGPIVQKDKVYVVEKVIPLALTDGLRLVGSTCFWKPTGEECGYCYTAFRKLEEIQAENKLKREQEEAAALKEATQLINSEP